MEKSSHNCGWQRTGEGGSPVNGIVGKITPESRTEAKSRLRRLTPVNALQVACKGSLGWYHGNTSSRPLPG